MTGNDAFDPRHLFARLRFRHLQLLVALKSTGTLMAAARLLNVTQPAMSKALREVEAVFGFALFVRGARGLAPTPQGEIAIRGAALLLEELAHVGAEASSDPARTVLRIGAPPFVAQGYLPAVLARLVGEHVRVQLEEERVPLLLRSLLDGRLDALITSYPAEMPESAAQLRYENLFDVESAVIAPPGHHLVASRRVSWRQLAREAWILPSRVSMLRRVLEEMFRQAGVAAPVPVVEALSPVTSMRMVAGGLGLCAAPVAVLAEALAAGKVCRLRVSPVISAGPVALIYRAAPESPRVALLRQALGLA